VADVSSSQTVASESTHWLTAFLLVVIGIVVVGLFCCVAWREAVFGAAVPSECPEEPPRSDEAAHARWRKECAEKARQTRERDYDHDTHTLVNPNQLRITLGLGSVNQRRDPVLEGQRLLA